MPRRIDIDPGSGGEPAGALDYHRPSPHGVMDTISEHRRSDQKRLARLLGGEVVQKEALAGEHSLESFNDPTATTATLGGRLDGQAWGHGNHGAYLTGDRLALVEFESQCGGRRRA